MAKTGIRLAREAIGDVERRVLVSVKCNLSKAPKGLSYHTAEASNRTVVIIWDGEVDEAADELLRPGIARDRRPGRRDRAVDWLRQMLSDGPKPATEVKAAADEAGIARRTLDR